MTSLGMGYIYIFFFFCDIKRQKLHCASRGASFFVLLRDILFKMSQSKYKNCTLRLIKVSSLVSTELDITLFYFIK